MTVSRAAPAPRNIVIFVADGLRAGSVDADHAPTMYALAQRGVRFSNSHCLFPTVTMPNSSAIATGHQLGDTGVFGNTLFIGRQVFGSGNFVNKPGTPTPNLENDQAFGDVDDLFGGSILPEETLLAAARAHGFATASVGKIGPTLMQDASEGAPVAKSFQTPRTIIIDDATGQAAGLPLAADVASALAGAGLGLRAPDRSNGAPKTSQQNNSYSGNSDKPGTTSANTTQQQYFADALTKAILPSFKAAGKPFAVVFWSRDPDGTQHYQGDSLGTLSPGINGPTSLAAVRNADDNLAQILAALKSLGLDGNTDVFVTSDHGFNTISHRELDANGDVAGSYAASQIYRDSAGRQEVPTGSLPPGFLAIDLAHALALPLFDPDTIVGNGDAARFATVDPTTPPSGDVRQRPIGGNAMIGGAGAGASGGAMDAKLIVTANGGADLIYLPQGDIGARKQQAAGIVAILTGLDYVSGIYVDDNLGRIGGALPLSAAGLAGGALTPRPAVIVSLRSFALDPAHPYQTGVLVADTPLQEGQGQHGGFDRADTYNFMAAAGPDFKTGMVDDVPASNADIAVTLAQIAGWDIRSRGKLRGRAVSEALVGGAPPTSMGVKDISERSSPAKNGFVTELRASRVGAVKYFDAAGSANRTNGL